MIYTLTTNPAIDMNICTDKLEARKVNRTRDAVYTPNGKGLNVSFVLKHFGYDSRILGFFGGFSGRYIVDEATNKGVQVLPIWGNGITRINIFLNDGVTEYKLVNEGAFIDKEQQGAMLESMRKLDDLEYLIISGSLPRGIEPEYYDDILSLCQQKGSKVILDISSAKLAELLGYKPLLIKPNDEEVSKIFGLPMDTEKNILQALQTLHHRGAQNILLTLGERGAYFFDGVHTYYAGTRPIKLLSSACAGDAALAAFLSVWLEHPEQVEMALQNMAATGANVAESNALGDFQNVEGYRKDILVKRVN